MTTDYDSQAGEWAGDNPKHLSDWVARPVVLERIKEIGKGKIVLDIGCGTGYFSRKVTSYVKKVIAFEKSQEMLKIAKHSEEERPLGIEYLWGDMTDMNFIAPGSVDICILNFVLPYIHPDEYEKVYSGISRALRPKGIFLIIQSHPCMFALAPHHTRGGLQNFDYKVSRGEFFEFNLPKATGGVVTVGQYNYTFEDLFKHCQKNNLAFYNIKELEIPKDLPEKLGAVSGEVPFIYLEGLKL